ncbi:MAG TPA: ABC transporter permease [Anaerolineales bacterium]|nr:ABC transporter permease [Anaerolineales bacterium]HNF95419.1 ABC transporter permease [Anaerolineales bacterium]HNH25545.1 ABC transporter permease [Anaerolineales bacterium]HNM36266.1 ABC transporter permease [Anaerolineales bacterium]HNO94956.1 ABC transporter permease [Anaerolineales bacterium]
MFNTRIVSIVRKEFVQIFRDPRSLALIIVMPIIQLFLLGYAATTDVKNVPIAVLDQSQSAQSRELLDAFRAADYFRIDYVVGSTEEYQLLIESGKIRAALVIPPDYDVQVLDGKAQVLFVLDGSDGSVGATALSTARLIGQSYSTKVQTSQFALRGSGSLPTQPVEVRTQVWYNPDFQSAYFMIPGVIGMILSFITTILTATTIVRERERGTIEQLIVTPIRSWELIVGKLLPYVILAFVETFEILIVGHLAFDVPVRGSLLLITLASGLFLMSSLGIGLFASTIANTQQEAMLSVMMFNLPMIFLSGFFFPVQAMPQFLQFVSLAIPLRYYLVVIRALMLKGVGFAAIQSEIISLTIFGIVIMGIAALRFRKRLD